MNRRGKVSFISASEFVFFFKETKRSEILQKEEQSAKGNLAVE